MGLKVKLTKEQKQFNRILFKCVSSEECYRIIDSIPELKGCTPMNGGCLLVAKALKSYLGRKAKIFAIGSSGFGLEHFVVYFNDFFIDYYGPKKVDQMLKMMDEDENLEDPYLFIATPSTIEDSNINPPVSKVRKLVTLFKNNKLPKTF